MVLWLAERGAETRSIADERTSRSCAELQEAQAEAGPLMLMVRRANMALSIAAGRRIRKALKLYLGPYHATFPSFGNASGAAASAARARAASSSIWRTSACTES